MDDSTAGIAPATPQYTPAELKTRQRWARQLAAEHPGWNIRLSSHGTYFMATRGSSTVMRETMTEFEEDLGTESDGDEVLAGFGEL